MPLWGVELDPKTMVSKTERIELIHGDGYERGYERMGVDNCEFPRSEAEVEVMFQEFVKQSGTPLEQLRNRISLRSGGCLPDVLS